MKSVIMIAYNFPPEGNAGAYRPLRFVRRLPLNDWKPIVITLKTDYYERFDPGLMDLIPAQAEVIRIENRDPWQVFQARRTRRARERILNSSGEIAMAIQAAHGNPFRSLVRGVVHTVESWCYHPDMAMTWIWPAVKAITNYRCAIKPSVIWATAPPWSSFIVAAISAHRFCVPYVLDFRDSWTMTYTNFERARPLWAKRLDRRILRKL